MHLVRRLGRANGWTHDYYRTIGWSEFWASLAEATVKDPPAHVPYNPIHHAPDGSDPLIGHELRILTATGRPTPFAKLR